MQATREVTIRDFLIFQLKLSLGGMKDFTLITVSIAALLVDMLSGGGRQERIFYRVLGISERFDLWINLNGAASKLDESDDGLFGASVAGSDSLLGKLEQFVRGGDVPRRERARAERPAV